MVHYRPPYAPLHTRFLYHFSISYPSPIGFHHVLSPSQNPSVLFTIRSYCFDIWRRPSTVRHPIISRFLRQTKDTFRRPSTGIIKKRQRNNNVKKIFFTHISLVIGFRVYQFISVCNNFQVKEIVHVTGCMA